MIRKLFFILFLLATGAAAQAQVKDQFSRELFVQQNTTTGLSDTLPYRLLQPPGDKSQPLPLIIWLHGKGERGKDNEKQLQNGVEIIADSVLHNPKYAAFILAPQCPPDQYWSVYDKTAAHMVQALDPTAVELHLLALINEVMRNYRVDASRVYIMGISMGGFGVWDMITRWPEKFAAAVPICGGGDPTKAPLLKNLPVRSYHGLKDKVINPAFTVEIMNELSSYQAEGTSLITLYPEVGHNAWDYAITDPGLLPWLFARRK